MSPALMGAKTKFNQALERRIQKAIRVTMSSGASRGRNPPNESTVFSFASTMTVSNQSLDSVPGSVGGGGRTQAQTAVSTTEMPRDSGYMSNRDLIQQPVEAEPLKSPAASLGGQQVDCPEDDQPEPGQMEGLEPAGDGRLGQTGVAETTTNNTPDEATVPDPPEMAHSALGSVCSGSARSVPGLDGLPTQSESALPLPTIPAALIPGAPAPLRDPSTTRPENDRLNHPARSISEGPTTRQDDHPAVPISEAPTWEGSTTGQKDHQFDHPAVLVSEATILAAPTTGAANINSSLLFQNIPPNDALSSINQIPTLPEYHYPSAISPTTISSETLLSKSQSPFRDSTSRYTTPPRRSKTRTKIVRLIRGQFYSHRLDIPSPRPFCYTTGHLAVYPEFTNDKILSHRSSRSADPVEMLIRWLDPEEQASLGVSGLFLAPKVIAVDSIPDSTDLDSGSPDQVFVAHGPDVVEMRVVRSFRG